jgi:hypothetical protein
LSNEPVKLRHLINAGRALGALLKGAVDKRLCYISDL